MESSDRESEKELINELTSFIILIGGHEISNNVVCATSKGSDQPKHTRTLIRAFASRLNYV